MKAQAHRQDVGTYCGETTQLFKGEIKQEQSWEVGEKRGGERRRRRSGGIFLVLAARRTGGAEADESEARRSWI